MGFLGLADAVSLHLPNPGGPGRFAPTGVALSPLHGKGRPFLVAGQTAYVMVRRTQGCCAARRQPQTETAKVLVIIGGPPPGTPMTGSFKAPA